MTSFPIHQLKSSLTGRVSADPSDIESAGSDHGHIVRHRPRAVVYPASESDVVDTVRFAAAVGAKVVARGQGHSTFGQAQCGAGLVLDMSSYRGVSTTDPDALTIRAGTTWREVVEQSSTTGLAPKILPDILDLSVGGMMSVGGVGSQSFRHGLMIDQVLSLRIVTASGEIVHASPEAHSELFHAVLGGLGQFGIIAELTVAATPIPDSLVNMRLVYGSPRDFLDDLLLGQDDVKTYAVSGCALFGPDSKLQLILDLAGTGAVLEELKSRLSQRHSHEESQPVSYSELSFRNHAGMEELKAAGLWEIPHPWIDVFMPVAAAAEFFGRELEAMTPDDMGPAGMLVFYPVRRHQPTTGSTSTPAGDRFVEMGLLRTTQVGDDRQVQDLVERNRHLMDRAIAAGGKQYPIGAVAMEASDWRLHFGERWPQLCALKARWDPQLILGDPRGLGWQLPQGHDSPP